MAPKNGSPSALFLALNILMFAIVSSGANCPTPIPPRPPTPKPTPPTPIPTPPTPSTTSCPRDTLKLGVCSSVLDGMFNFTMGVPSTPCCSFLGGLADFDFAICICTALKANVMGFNINIPISFTQLLNFCSRQAPTDFLCSADNN